MGKLCRKCNTTKDLTQFYKCADKKDGHASNCKQCKLSYSQLNGEKYKQSFIKWKYGLNADDHKALLAKQGNKCAICESHQSEFQKSLAVDHCHATGKVRGLLCEDCNLGLGKFKDNPDRLKKAAEYLR